MNMEKILTKVRNLLDLANNNPNENEAMAAALKAQELMAKYNIDTSTLESDESEKELHESVYYDTGKHEMKKWKHKLAQIIAKNFCCKVYYMGRKDVVFYGFKKDSEIAVEVFKFLYEMGNKFAVRYYNKCKKEGKNTKGVMNTYLFGFCDGIAKVLEKQCTALMIVTPKEVVESFEAMSTNWKCINTSLKITSDRAAYDEGKTDGYNTACARGIE